MATSVLDHSSEARAGPPGLARALALDATVPVALAASAAIVIGLHWDIAWHRSIGRDTFWSPPHLLEQIAAALAGLFAGWRVIYTSLLGSSADRGAAVRFWRVFYGPLGGWVVIWGTIAMISSAPFDNWWHAAYGLDVKILTPPHVFLLLGMVTVQLGAMLMMLADQNRAGDATGGRRLLFPTSMGLVVLMVATMVYAETGLPNLQHAPKFYLVSALLFPGFLVGAARAGHLRWPATTAALTYMVLLMILNWVLVQVPAAPRLAPIYNPVTHLVPPGFPILMVVPAVVIDRLVRRTGLGDWALAPLLGVGFVAALLLVQWPMASFLLSLREPNPFFGTQYWEYSARLGPWTHSFFDVPGFRYVRDRGMVGSLDLAGMARGLAVAAGLGILSSRIGLWWGGWMTRVRR